MLRTKKPSHRSIIIFSLLYFYFFVVVAVGIQLLLHKSDGLFSLSLRPSVLLLLLFESAGGRRIILRLNSRSFLNSTALSLCKASFVLETSFSSKIPNHIFPLKVIKSDDDDDFK